MDEPVTDPGPVRGPDLSGMRREYRFSRRRGARPALAVLCGLQGVLALTTLLSSDLAPFATAATWVQLATATIAVLWIWCRPSATFLEPDGLRFRRNLRTGALTPWGEVREVLVEGPRQSRNEVVLADGGHHPLTGVPTADARRLGAALARWGATR